MDSLVAIMGQEWVDKVNKGIAATAHREKMQSFAAKMDFFRGKLRITQKEVGKRMGYSERSMCKYLYLGDELKKYQDGRIPPVDTLILLALALGADLEDIVPDGFDLKKHIKKSPAPDRYQSVTTFITDQLAQFYQSRDEIAVTCKSQLKNYCENTFDSMTERVFTLYASLKSVPDGRKFRILSEAIDHFYDRGLLQEYELECLLGNLLYKYFTHNRPEEQQEHWRYVAETAMEEMRSKRQEEYQEVEVSIDELLAGASDVEDGPPLKWSEIFGVIEGEQEGKEECRNASSGTKDSE